MQFNLNNNFMVLLMLLIIINVLSNNIKLLFLETTEIMFSSYAHIFEEKKLCGSAERH